MRLATAFLLLATPALHAETAHGAELWIGGKAVGDFSNLVVRKLPSS